MTAPVTAVLAQLEAGVRSVPDLAGRTGLAPDLVRAVVGRLVRSGRVAEWTLPSGCAPAGCSECAAACPISSLATR